VNWLCGKLGGMLLGSRSRLMLAALVFALGWASGAAMHRAGLLSLSAICLAIGSVALAYFGWEYHRAWRLRPSSSDRKRSITVRNWSGLAVNGLMIRPEYITAGVVLLFCALGMYKYFQVTPSSSIPIVQSPPAIVLPEARPLQ
jgi:hypothetical protein